MKKLFAFAALIALLLSLGTVFAAAELPPVEWAQGSYASLNLASILTTWNMCRESRYC